MLLNTLTPVFKKFLQLLLLTIKSHQMVGIYYDTNHLDRPTGSKIKLTLQADFGGYYNIIPFTEYIPGFLTNPDGVSLFGGKSNFAFIIFLNFNYRSPKQRSLLQELINYKIEYILISSTDLDLVGYVPYLYIKADLSNMNLFNIFRFYASTFLKLNLNSVRHNFADKSQFAFKTKLLVLNCLYLINLFRKPKLLNKEIAIYCYTLKKKKLLRSNFEVLRKFVPMLLLRTKLKQKFYIKLIKEPFISDLLKSKRVLKYKLCSIFKTYLIHPFRFISFFKIKKYIIEFKSRRLKFR